MFRSLTAKNFFSWNQLDFDFKSGVTLIAGQNLDDNTSEGSGKSSIPNALCWALYGQLPKDVNIDDVIKTGAKTCTVEVLLEDGTFIVRSRKPNQLFIQNGTSVETGKDLKETQKLVDNLIGMSFDTFCQSVYFAQNYSNKFITANQEQKAKILSELQDLSVFDKASKKAHEMLKKSTSELSMIEIRLSEKTLSYNHHLSNVKSLEELSKNFKTEQSKKLDELKLKHTSIISKAQHLSDQMNLLGQLESIIPIQETLQDNLLKRNQINQQLYHIQQLELQKAQANNDKVCPSCNRALDKQDVCFDIPDTAGLLKTKQSLDLEISRLTDLNTDLMSKKSKNEQHMAALNDLKRQEYELDLQVKSLELSANPYSQLVLSHQSQIEPLQKTIDTLRSDQDKLKTHISYLEFLKSGYKEIKSYVFQGLLSQLNNKTNKYLRDLFDVPAFITFDNVSEEGDISKIKTTVVLNGYERSLGLLSGGQFRRVQLAVDFALSDIVSQRSQSPINVRILDESFKDLSETSMEKIIAILQKMNGCTILIEHNSLVKNIVDRVYNVELKDGTSSSIS